IAGDQECHITRITPRKTCPHFGEPEIIEEYALQHGKEILLTKTVNHFSKHGLVVKTELFADTLESTTYKTYDTLHRLTSTTDAIGRTTLLTYNTSGKLASKRTPSLTTNYHYNRMGNLTVQTEKDFQGSTHINRYSYDLLGQKICHTNP